MDHHVGPRFLGPHAIGQRSERQQIDGPQERDVDARLPALVPRGEHGTEAGRADRVVDEPRHGLPQRRKRSCSRPR